MATKNFLILNNENFYEIKHDSSLNIAPPLIEETNQEKNNKFISIKYLKNTSTQLVFQINAKPRNLP